VPGPIYRGNVNTMPAVDSVGNQYVANLNFPALATKASKILVWSGLLFRSQAELNIAQALDKAEVLYFPNARARLHRQGERVNYEPDFVVFNRIGRTGIGILEVDGPQHRWKVEEDHTRDRLFKSYGIRVIERFADTECRDNPDYVVRQFLFLLREAYR